MKKQLSISESPIKKHLLELLIILIFLPLFILFWLIPPNELPKEFFGYFAYTLPIMAIIVAGESIFKKDQAGEHKKTSETEDLPKKAFFQSTIFLFLGVASYLLYTIWHQIPSNQAKLNTILWVFALLLILTGACTYHYHHKDKKHPFIRFLFGTFFFLIGVLTAFVMLIK